MTAAIVYHHSRTPKRPNEGFTDADARTRAIGNLASMRDVPGQLWERLADFDVHVGGNPYARSVVSLPLYRARLADAFHRVWTERN